MDGQLNKILINNKFYETRVAYLKDNSLFYYFNENKSDISIVGNIYKGKVARVLPGLQSAFVDIGQDKAAFLHVSDLLYQHISREDREAPIPSDIDISDMIAENNELLIQVTKDPISTKGPRVVTLLSIPGRFLVFFPIGNKVGISKKIESEAERSRLKRIIENYKPKDTAFIARTAAEGVSDEMLENDMRICMQQWINIVKKQKKLKAPHLLYEDLALPLKIARDMLNNSVSELVIDDKAIYNKVIDFVEEFMPSQRDKVKFYDDNQVGLFKKYNLESKIRKLDNKSAPLKSGGNIIIEQVEALTVVDVNTGSFVGKNLQHDDTILQTNKEAMDAVAEQIRLRNIGGIIIVDFIDMKSDADKEILIKHGELVTKNDRANVTIHGITKLGLMQITRKRISDSLRRSSTTICKPCNGRGSVKSYETITHEIYQKIIEMDRSSIVNKTLDIFVEELLLNYINNNEKNNIKKLKEKFKTSKIVFTKKDNFVHGQFDINIKAKKVSEIKEIKIEKPKKQKKSNKKSSSAKIKMLNTLLEKEPKKEKAVEASKKVTTKSKKVEKEELSPKPNKVAASQKKPEKVMDKKLILEKESVKKDIVEKAITKKNRVEEIKPEEVKPEEAKLKELKVEKTKDDSKKELKKELKKEKTTTDSKEVASSKKEVALTKKKPVKKTTAKKTTVKKTAVKKVSKPKPVKKKLKKETVKKTTIKKVAVKKIISAKTTKKTKQESESQSKPESDQS